MPAGASEDFLFCAVEIDSYYYIIILLLLLFQYGMARRTRKEGDLGITQQALLRLHSQGLLAAFNGLDCQICRAMMHECIEQLHPKPRNTAKLKVAPQAI